MVWICGLLQRTLKGNCLFLKKNLRKIWPSERTGLLEDTSNNKLNVIHREPNEVKVMKLATLHWAGHVKRMEDSDISKKISLVYHGKYALGIRN